MTKYSILDLAHLGADERPATAFARSLALAQSAEKLGYYRIWYAEHHNMPSIASSAPAVLISHIAAKTSHIRLGAGGVMLPNHAPLLIAEQFGTLAELYPNRIDLGLGRAPGTDSKTLRALRRDYESAERFPQDVKELQGYLGDQTLVPGINAVPGRGSHVPLYILGSSLFGASLAGALGLPYAFASHFAPDLYQQAIKVYRDKFIPSAQCQEPYVIAAANFIAADSKVEAEEQRKQMLGNRVRALVPHTQKYSDREIDAFIKSGAADQILNMFRITGAGTAPEVSKYLQDFAALVAADEMMLVNASPTTEQASHGLKLLAGEIL
ncbi:MAG: LLM class flavin-dependent oxidoreductase [Rothia sp. (in: high G+C Gram-positive bacteria)]|nr:LLM class flavin-dependent oxidoreductase [Rothia sp. (in: high G+C Gram-positive bacteria)]